MASLFRPPQSARPNPNVPKLELPSMGKLGNGTDSVLMNSGNVVAENLYISSKINGFKSTGDSSSLQNTQESISNSSTQLKSLTIPPISSSSSSNTTPLSSARSDSTLVPTLGVPQIRHQPQSQQYYASSDRSTSSSSTRKNRPLPPPLPPLVVNQTPKGSPTMSIDSNRNLPGSNNPSPDNISVSLKNLKFNNSKSSSSLYLKPDLSQSVESYTSNLISAYGDNIESPVKSSSISQPISLDSKVISNTIYDKLNNNSDIDRDIDKLDSNFSDYSSIKDKIVTLGLLGEGAGGSVAKCKLKNGSKIFALKTINTLNSAPEFQKQIFRELQFNKSFKCEHIVQYYGTFKDVENSSILIAMEYMGGRSLESIYKHLLGLGGRISEKVLGKIAESVLKGLSYLHEKKVIHRDIKPQNILLNDKGEVKLCDFGVSGEAVNSLATTFTGTSFYMAPERIKGQPYSVTCDVWSLGLTLLEVAQAKFPFGSNNEEKHTLSISTNIAPIELLMLIVTFTPVLNDEPKLNIVWSKSFKSFIEYCLKKDPRERPSPRQMINHPWIQGQMKKKVNMEKFIKKCWKDEEANETR